MSSAGATVTETREEHAGGLGRLRWMASVVFFGVLPVLALYTLFVGTVSDDVVATDFEQFYRAAEAILSGQSPYLDPHGATWGGPYPYPPLPALAAAPLTALSLDVAGLVAMGVLVVVALSVPFVLGVRDWRCYSLVLVWPPVISAIQTANLTLWFALACALAWRFRDRLLPPAASVGVTLAMKFFLWPVAVWLAATRRVGAAVATCVIGAGLLVTSWAAIGFAGFRDYPDLLRRLEDVVGADSYTLYIVGLDAGLPSVVARGIWLAAGLAVLGAVVIVGRRGGERSAFILAIAASLALTPIVWLHYFALLLVVVALAQPQLGALWFVPLGMVLTPGSGQPTPFQTAWTLAIATFVFVLALRGAERGVSWRAPDHGAAEGA